MGAIGWLRRGMGHEMALVCQEILVSYDRSLSVLLLVCSTVAGCRSKKK